MKTVLSLFIMLALTVQAVQAQKFSPAFRRFSKVKPGYLLLNSDERIDFTVRKIKRKKGNIIWLKGRSLNGLDKFKYRAKEIKELVLVPSLFAKVGTFGDGTESAVELTKTDFSDFGKLAHFYQESATQGRRKALYQIANPSFDTKIRVYTDPRSKETSGVGVSGIKLTGGLDKSYYVKYNGRFVKVRKSSYGRWFNEQFGNCQSLTAKYGKRGAWRDFADHVYYHATNCQ